MGYPAFSQKFSDRDMLQREKPKANGMWRESWQDEVRQQIYSENRAMGGKTVAEIEAEHTSSQAP